MFWGFCFISKWLDGMRQTVFNLSFKSSEGGAIWSLDEYFSPRAQKLFECLLKIQKISSWSWRVVGTFLVFKNGMYKFLRPFKVYFDRGMEAYHTIGPWIHLKSWCIPRSMVPVFLSIKRDLKFTQHNYSGLSVRPMIACFCAQPYVNKSAICWYCLPSHTFTVMILVGAMCVMWHNYQAHFSLLDK